MANYPKFDLSNVIGNAYDTAVELYHTWSGDKAKVDELWMIYHSELARAERIATKANAGTLTDDARESIVNEWSRVSIAEMLKSTHPEWVVEKVLGLIMAEAGL